MEHMADMQQKYGEGTKTDLDYGKLVILGLCIYIAIQKRYRDTRFIPHWDSYYDKEMKDLDARQQLLVINGRMWRTIQACSSGWDTQR